jgi:hypothetical protein
MHHTFVLGAIGHVVGFGDRQGINVGAQGYGAARALASFNLSDEAGASYFSVWDAKFIQLASDVALGIVFLKA